MKLVLVLLVGCLLVGTNAFFYSKDTYPDLKKDPSRCTTYKYVPQFICDPEGILKEYELEALDSALEHLNNKTVCLCNECSKAERGIKAYIALSKDIFRKHQAQSEDVLIEMADHLRTKWHLGTCGNDFLIFKVAQAQMIYTSLGTAVQKYISEDFAKKTSDSIIRKSTSPATSLTQIISEYKAEYKTKRAEMSKPTEAPKDHTGVVVGSVVGGIVGGVLVVIIIVAIICTAKMGRTKFRHKKGPEAETKVKVTKTGSVLYSEVAKDDPEPGKEEETEKPEVKEKPKVAEKPAPKKKTPPATPPPPPSNDSEV